VDVQANGDTLFVRIAVQTGVEVSATFIAESELNYQQKKNTGRMSGIRCLRRKQLIAIGRRCPVSLQRRSTTANQLREITI
jgi:hypothetical protein